MRDKKVTNSTLNHSKQYNQNNSLLFSPLGYATIHRGAFDSTSYDHKEKHRKERLSHTWKNGRNNYYISHVQSFFRGEYIFSIEIGSTSL